jgi:hypothetical protein
LGNAEGALATLNEAEAQCRAQDAQWNLWQVLALRAQVHATLGQGQMADTDRRAARAVIESIVARTPEPLRTGFLNQAHQSYEF